MNAFWQAWGGTWRLTYRRLFVPRHWLVGALLVALLAVVSLPAIRVGQARPFFVWTTDFYLCLVLPIFAFLSGAGAIRDDMKPGAVDYLFTRPVRRPAYLACRYLSHLACAQVDFLAALAVLAGLGWFRHVPGVLAAAPLLLLTQAMTLAAFSAFGFLCGVLTSRYVVIGLVYAGLVEAGIGNIPTELNRLSMTHEARVMLGALTRRANAAAIFEQAPAAAALHLLLLAAGMVAVAATWFAFQELTGPPGDA